MRVRPFFLVTGLLAAVAPAGAQQFSAEELEVWQAVEECQQYFAEEDEAALDACTHEDFTGWLYGEDVPRTKASNQLSTRLQWEQLDTYGYDLRPLQIRVIDNVAIVHYYWTWIYVDQDGLTTTESGRWTDILVNDQGRWAWIADHGGPTPG
ncbi:MAG: nuclear transport factor 2 family protein [Gemmatimonadetes bacterium]|nr:nuclear transport factor 2 family protein [Gemmatimonadota bacterium]